MNRSSLKRLLEAKSGLSWLERQIDGSEEFVKWLPVISFECSAGVTHSGGISINGNWCSEYADKKRITTSEFYACFYTILEFPLKEFIQLLKNSIQESGLPENIIKTYPFDEVMLNAMRTSQHWSSLADSWLEQGYLVSPQIALEFPEHKAVKCWQKQRIEEIINA